MTTRPRIWWKSVPSRVRYESGKEFTWQGHMVYYHPYEELAALAWLLTHC